MKTKLLKKIRKHLHVKHLGKGKVTMVYTRDFSESMTILRNMWNPIMREWWFHLRIPPFAYRRLIEKRIIRDNKRSFNKK